MSPPSNRKTPIDPAPSMLSAHEERLRALEFNYDLLRQEVLDGQSRSEDADRKAENALQQAREVRGTHARDLVTTQSDISVVRALIEDFTATLHELDTGIGRLLGEGATTATLTEQTRRMAEEELAKVRASLKAETDAILERMQGILQQMTKGHSDLRVEIKEGDEEQASRLAKIATTRRLLLAVVVTLAPSIKDATAAIYAWARLHF